jgi:uncharacterized membrane protein
MKSKLGKYLYWVMAVFPFILSAAFYSRLPAQVPIHWDMAGEPNGYASRVVGAFGVPAMLLIITLFLNFRLSADPRKQNIDRSPQLKFIVRWMIVILSNVCQCITIFSSINKKVNVSFLISIFVGLMITAMGNYLPKCKYNYTMGIRLPWTLASEENWRKTHRFAGFVWIIGGILMVLDAFVPFQWLTVCIIVLLAVVPGIYSYLVFLKEKAS